MLDLCDRWEVRGVGGRHGDDGGRPAAHARRARRRGAGRRARRVPPRRRPRLRPPRRPPSDLEARRADDPRAALPRPRDCGADLLALLADTSWVWSQYDHQLFLNTVEGPGGDAVGAAAQAPDHAEDTGRALALTTDGNHRWCARRPAAGHRARSWPRRRSTSRASGPVRSRVVNCLNFGNPEHPEVMWQLSEAIDGMAEACRSARHAGGRRQRQPLQREPRPRHRPDAGRRHARTDRSARPAPALGGSGRRRTLLLLGETRARARRLGMGLAAPRAPRRAACPRSTSIGTSCSSTWCAGLWPAGNSPASTTFRRWHRPWPWPRWPCARASASRWRASPITSRCSPSRRRVSCCASSRRTSRA